MEKFYEQLYRGLSKPVDLRDSQDLQTICNYLRSLEALANVRASVIDELATIARLEHHDQSKFLFRKNDFCDSWYILISGAALVDDCLFLPPSIFGTRSFGPYRQQDCRVLIPSDLIVIDYPKVLKAPTMNILSSTLVRSGAIQAAMRALQRSDALELEHPDSVVSKETTSTENPRQDLNNDASCAPSATDKQNQSASNSKRNVLRLAASGSSYTSTSQESASNPTGNGGSFVTSIDGDDETASGASGSEHEDGEDELRRDSFPIAIRGILEKGASERSVEEIEVLLNHVQPLAAFARQPYDARRALCQRMVMAVIDKASTVVYNDGDEVDAWCVVMRGSLELRKGDTRQLVSVGEAFGVNINSKSDRFDGQLRTLSDCTHLLSVSRVDYEQTMQELLKNSVSETDDTGRVVLMKERRAANGATGPYSFVIVRATADRLLCYLIEEHPPSDASFVDDFLLTHRVFIDSSTRVFEKLMDWYRNPVLRDRVIRIVLRWLTAELSDFTAPPLSDELDSFERQLIADGQDAQLSLFRLAKPRPASEEVVARSRLHSISSVSKTASAHALGESVIRVYRTEQSYKYIKVQKDTTARQVVDVALSECDHNVTSGFSLCEVSADLSGLMCQKKLLDSACELADRLPPNARYFIKPNVRTDSLVADDAALVAEMVKDLPTGILQLEVNDIVRCITLDDFQAFRAVPPHQYISDLFKLREVASGIGPCEELRKFAGLSDTERFWTVNEVLNAKNQPARTRILKRFIQMAELFKKLRNYNSMFAIVSGLGHHAVVRLKESWDRLPGKYRRKFEQLDKLLDPTRSHLNYRTLLRDAGNGTGVCSPTIPIYPFFCHDLTFMILGNYTIIDGLVNFEKMRLVGREIRQLVSMASTPYDATAFGSDPDSMLHGHGNVSNTNNNAPGPVTSVSAVGDREGSALFASIANKRLPKKIYEEGLSMRRVRAYLHSVQIERDDERLAEMSYALEAPSKTQLSLHAAAVAIASSSQSLHKLDSSTPRSSAGSIDQVAAPTSPNTTAPARAIFDVNFSDTDCRSAADNSHVASSGYEEKPVMRNRSKTISRSPRLRSAVEISAESSSVTPATQRTLAPTPVEATTNATGKTASLLRTFSLSHLVPIGGSSILRSQAAGQMQGPSNIAVDSDSTTNPKPPARTRRPSFGVRSDSTEGQPINVGSPSGNVLHMPNIRNRRENWLKIGTKDSSQCYDSTIENAVHQPVSIFAHGSRGKRPARHSNYCLTTSGQSTNTTVHRGVAPPDYDTVLRSQPSAQFNYEQFRPLANAKDSKSCNNSIHEPLCQSRILPQKVLSSADDSTHSSLPVTRNPTKSRRATTSIAPSAYSIERRGSTDSNDDQVVTAV